MKRKRFGELLCKAYNDPYGLGVKIGRLFNSYGPRLRPEGSTEESFRGSSRRPRKEKTLPCPVMVYGLGLFVMSRIA